MNDIEKEADRVRQILDRLMPRIHQFLDKTADKEGENIVMSVAANISTSMVAMCLMMLKDRGGDIDAFMLIILQEIREKYTNALGKRDAQLRDLNDHMIASGYDTCQPLH